MRYSLAESLLRFWGRRSVDARIVEGMLKSHVAGVAIFDQALRCVQANAELARLARTTPAQLIGRSLEQILGAQRSDELSAITRVLMTGVSVLDRIVQSETLKLRVDYLPLRGETTQPSGVVIVAVDLSAQRRVEAALAERLATSQLISELSASFIDLPPADIDGGIERAIRVIGERVGLDGTHIGVIDEDRQSWRMTHEWVSERGKPTIDRFRSGIPLGSWMKWSADRLLGGEPVIIASREELPPEAAAERELFRALGYQSLVELPLKTGTGRVTGGFAVFSSVEPRGWTPEVLATLRLTAEILANALDRRRNESALRERLAFEEALAVIATRFIAASVDAVDGAIEEALRVIGQTLHYERTAVFLLDDPPERLGLAYEWCAPDVRSFRGSMSGLKIQRLRLAARSRSPPARWSTSITARCPKAPTPRAASSTATDSPRSRRCRCASRIPSSAASASTRAPAGRSTTPWWHASASSVTSSPARWHASARSWRGAPPSPSWRS